MNHRAFTLIELLMVISIIAVLAALLLPAIGLIKFIAVGNKCMSNQRQLVIGIISYTSEWGAELPYVSGLPTNRYTQGRQSIDWGYSCEWSMPGQVFPYTETMAIARCPADSFAGSWADDTTKFACTTANCPSPDTCHGRSYAYAAQVLFVQGGVVRGLDISRYTDRMKTAVINAGYSRFTGVNAAGERFGQSNSNHNPWKEIWGSTVVADMWSSNHNFGSKRGAALVNITGSARWRTFSDIQPLPYVQLHRYEEP
jgi:prepilin-type N-terminal cleavage/methylation domain-containing protein